METPIAVSIVIPAHNAGNVIEKCVESVCSQTLKNIEILVVDDASSDHTRKIIKNMAQRDSRILLIEKNVNEGVSAARNSALQIAKGEYIGFVDADDWMEKDCLEKIYTQGNHADVIVAGYFHDTMDEDRSNLEISRTVSMKPGFWNQKCEIARQAAYIDTNKMYAYVWNKLYKKSILQREKIFFPNQALNEDFIFNIRCWHEISSLSIVDYIGYHYIKSSKDTLTQRFIPDFWDIMDKRYEYMKNLMGMYEVYNGDVKEQVGNVYIKHAIAGAVRNCSPAGNYSFVKQYGLVKEHMKSKDAREARKSAKGVSKQEKACNLVYKTNCAFFVLILGKIIYAMQTRTKNMFDKLK